MHHFLDIPNAGWWCVSYRFAHLLGYRHCACKQILLDSVANSETALTVLVHKLFMIKLDTKRRCHNRNTYSMGRRMTSNDTRGLFQYAIIHESVLSRARGTWMSIRLMLTIHSHFSTLSSISAFSVSASSPGVHMYPALQPWPRFYIKSVLQGI